MTSHALRSDSLKRTLKANSVFSAATGAALAAASPAFADVFGLAEPRIFLFIGLGLILFALGVFLAARRELIRAFDVRVILAADVGWVLGSIALLTLAPQAISASGRILVAVAAAAVAAFSLAEYRGLRPLR